MENRMDAADSSTKPRQTPESSNYEEPRDELEQAIAQLWQDLFHLARVGRNDNFFELGGNSLLGMDLSEMFETRLAFEVPVLTIFQHPTVGEIAQVIASR